MLKAGQLFYFYFLVFKVYVTAFPRWFLDVILTEMVFLDSGLVFSLDGPFCSQCIEASSTDETFTRNLAIIAASSGVESAQRHSPQLHLIFFTQGSEKCILSITVSCECRIYIYSSEKFKCTAATQASRNPASNTTSAKKATENYYQRMRYNTSQSLLL